MGYVVLPSSQQELASEQQSVPLSEHLGLLRTNLWRISGFIGGCIGAALVISSRLTNLYESTAVLDIDRQARSVIIGQDATSGSQPNYDADQFIAGQIRLIQSDAVLRPVAERYNLLQQEEQFGSASAEFADRVRRAPVTLKRLKVARPANTYLVLISYRSPDPQLAADVANAVTQSYLAHTYSIRAQASTSLATFMEKQLGELKSNMERSGAALTRFERELNVMNPEEKTSIVSARLLQLNAEYTNAQSDRVRKEAIWNSIKSDTIEAAQVSGHADALVQVTQKLNEARQRFAEVKTVYGDNHPEFRKAASQLTELEQQLASTRMNIAGRVDADYAQARNREEMLKKAVTSAKAEYDRLNTRSFEYQQLKREAEADKTIYDELIRRIKEAGINAGFQNSHVRIADVARPEAAPVYPNLRLNLIIAFLFSTLLSVGAVLLRDAVDTTVRNPEQTSRYFDADVIGTLPEVKHGPGLNHLQAFGLRESGSFRAPIGANGRAFENERRYGSPSSFKQAIRSVGAIVLGDMDAKPRSILITSAGAAEGKSTTAVHLAIVYAEQGNRTLLVDADLREPVVHRKLGLPLGSGLSSVLTQGIQWRDAVQRISGKPNLSVILSGPPCDDGIDILAPSLRLLLREFVREYDLIIIDAPPLLTFAEPLQISTFVDGVLVVVRAGQTERKAVSAVLGALDHLRARVVGVVLNQVKRETTDGYVSCGSFRSRYWRPGGSSPRTQDRRPAPNAYEAATSHRERSRHEVG